MDPTTSLLVAVLLSLASAGAFVACLWRPLLAVLTDLCGTEGRARFWRTYTNIVLVIVPLAAVLLGRVQGRPTDPGVFLVADQLRWALLGLIAALTLVALTLTSYLSRCPPAIPIRADQVDQLHRLLERVDEVRAEHGPRR